MENIVGVESRSKKEAEILDYILKALRDAGESGTIDENVLKVGGFYDSPTKQLFNDFMSILLRHRCCQEVSVNKYFAQYKLDVNTSDYLKRGGFKKIYKNDRAKQAGSVFKAKISRWQYYTYWPTALLGLIGGSYAILQFIQWLCSLFR
jgi:hypothetical protein